MAGADIEKDRTLVHIVHTCTPSEFDSCYLNGYLNGHPEKHSFSETSLFKQTEMWGVSEEL